MAGLGRRMPGRAIHWLRWALVAPAAVAAFCLVVVVSVMANDYFETALCPPEDMVSGFCYNDRVRLFLDFLTFVFSGVIAFAVLATAIAVAPAHKRIVAWLTFALGATAALVMGVGARANPEAICSVLVGLTTTIVYTVESRRRDGATTPA